MRILLVRHGPSAHVHDGSWIRRRAVAGYEDAYDAAGILSDCTPPDALIRVAASAQLICASDLPRAVASAERIARGRDVVTSPLLREIRLEPPPWIPLKLPIQVWDLFSHLQWSYRLLARTDHQYVQRAIAAAEWLEERTRTAQTVVAVTHGAFRRILAARLATLGWRATRARPRYEHWSVWAFERTAPVGEP